GRHIPASKTVTGEMLYRIPTQQPDTGDGNTVDVDLERNLFYGRINCSHRSSLEFLGSKFKNLSKAIKGD
ncbi:flagellar basal body rod protein FlgB, partial [Vibrio metschnikovii]